MSTPETQTATAAASSSSSVHKTCPVTGMTGPEHDFRAPQPGDSRSPCPALNTMANHGYIPRDGKKISAWQIVQGLVDCYGLTKPFAIFLSYTTFLVLRHFKRIDLYEIGKHGVVEHDASIVHRNTPPGETYAPIEIDRELLAEFVKEARAEVEVEVETADGKKEIEKQTLLTTADVGRARVRREKESPLDAIHAEIARGEVAIIMAVWETKTEKATGTRIDWLERWLGEERLPDGWRPTKRVGLFDTMKQGKPIKKAADAIWEAEKKKKD
ncbi:Cloroperoxidase [Coprinellus micaceus]|uniref:Cloroperoxidase n=1 Tax=Coprinellus micaceus TaxID=71717 RepID=A0A4Y7SRE4_COPMI|nr:Cloroperoxidase [Coprinellus micaceus]